MSWLASQSSFLLTFEILECKVYFPHVPQVSPVVQFHLYIMILKFPPCLLIFESKGAQGRLSNLGNVDYTGSGEMFSREFSLTQSLTILGTAGVGLSFLWFCQLTVHIPCLFHFCWSRPDL